MPPPLDRLLALQGPARGGVRQEEDIMTIKTLFGTALLALAAMPATAQTAAEF